MDKAKIRFLRMQRQFFTIKANEQDYLELYRDMQPGQNVYWNGFGQPPTLTPRPDFDDLEFNRRQQLDRQLIKGRFAGRQSRLDCSGGSGAVRRAVPQTAGRAERNPAASS